MNAACVSEWTTRLNEGLSFKKVRCIVWWLDLAKSGCFVGTPAASSLSLRPASLAQQEAELLGCPKPCHAGEPQGDATTEESLRVGTNRLCLKAQVFQLDVYSAECSTFFTLVGLLRFCSPPVKVKWLCFLETMCLSFEQEWVSVTPVQPSSPH